MLTEQLHKNYNQNKLNPDLSKSSYESDDTLDESYELPQIFRAKYLGSQDARGLWGIKHTRKPVDKMVDAVKSMPTRVNLPILKITISEDEVTFSSINKKDDSLSIHKVYPIRDISYGVQDIVYTRIFSMIVVRDTEHFRRMTPFECHGFVCESKYQARRLTYALANAFKMYTKKVKENEENTPQQKLPGMKINSNIRVDIICKT